MQVLTDDSGTSTTAGFEAALTAAAKRALVVAMGVGMKQAHEAWWAAKWASHFIHVSTTSDDNVEGAKLSSTRLAETELRTLLNIIVARAREISGASLI